MYNCSYHDESWILSHAIEFFAIRTTSIGISIKWSTPWLSVISENQNQCEQCNAECVQCFRVSRYSLVIKLVQNCVLKRMNQIGRTWHSTCFASLAETRTEIGNDFKLFVWWWTYVTRRTARYDWRRHWWKCGRHYVHNWTK